MFGSGFGSNNNTFGSNNNNQNRPAAGFGNSNTSGFGGNSNTGGFGGNSNTGGFGSTNNTGGFGSTNNTGGFGSTNTGGFGSNTSGGFGSTNTGGFGSNTSGGFGSNNANAGNSLFGSSAGGFGSNATTQPSGGFGSTGGFGQATNTFGSSTGGFGSSTNNTFNAPRSAGFNATSNTGGFGGMGSFGSASNTGSPEQLGTGAAPYRESKSDKNEKIIHICAADPYKPFNIEYLRLKDYELAKQGGSANATAGFGATNTGGFGSTNTTGGFGGFGNTATTTQPSTGFSSGFGSTNTNTGLSGFGANSNNPSTGFGGFGQNTQQGNTGGFGSTNTGGFGSTNTGGFGSTNTGGFGSSTGGFGSTNTAGGFGATNTTQANTLGGFGASKPFGTTGGFGSTTGGFGSTTGGFGATTTSGGFGSTAAPSGFGQKPAGGLFGTTTTTTGFGATPAPTSSFGFGGTNTGTTGGGFGGFGATNQTNSFSLGATTGVNAASTPAASGFSFGATNTANKPLGGFGGFGATTTTQPATTSTFSFGSTAPSSGFGGFGATNNTSSLGLFGASSQPATTTTSLFGNSLGATNNLSFGSSGATNITSFGNLTTQPNQQSLHARIDNNPYGNLSTSISPKKEEKKPEAPRLYAVSQDAKPIINSYAKLPARDVSRIKLRNYGGSVFFTAPQFSGLSRYSTPFNTAGNKDKGAELDPRFTPRRNARRLVIEPDNSTSASALNSAAKTTLSRSVLENNQNVFSEANKFLSNTPKVNSDKSSLLGPDTPTRTGNGFLNSSIKRSPGKNTLINSDAFTKISPGKTVEENKYEFTPSLETLLTYSDEQLQSVEHFTIELPFVGKIEWLEAVNLLEASPTGTREGIKDIAGSIVIINPKHAVVYPDEDKKASRGQGLNVPAKISLAGCWAKQRRTEYIKDPAHPKYEEQLKKLRSAPETEFIDFKNETGTWIFKVKHFSIYGLDEDDSPYVNKNENNYNDQNKKSFFESSQQRLVAGGKQNISHLNDDNSNEPTSIANRKNREIVDLSQTWGIENEEMVSPDNNDGDDLLVLSQDENDMDYAENLNTTVDIIASLLQERQASILNRREQLSGIFNQKEQQLSNVPNIYENNSLSALPFSLAKTNNSSNDLVSRKRLLEDHKEKRIDEKKTFFAKAFIHKDTLNKLEVNHLESEQIVPSKEDEMDMIEDKNDSDNNNFNKLPRLNESITYSLIDRNHIKSSVDMGIFMSRSFRAGWGPRNSLVSLSNEALIFNSLNFSKILSGSLEYKLNSSESLLGQSKSYNSITIKSLKTLLNFSKVIKNQNAFDGSDCCVGPYTIVPSLEVSNKLQFRDFVRSLSDNIDNEETLLWKLCVALFDNVVPNNVQKSIQSDNHFVWGKRKNIIEDGYRREEISRWFIETNRKNVKSLLDDTSLELLKGKDAHRILSFLSGRQITSAIKEAIGFKNLKLASVLTQVGGSSNIVKVQRLNTKTNSIKECNGNGVPARGGTDAAVAYQIQKQVSMWKESNDLSNEEYSGATKPGVSYITETRMNIWELIGGDISSWGKGVYQYAKDWKQLLALFFWYGNAGNWTIDEAVSFFENNIEIHGKCPYPKYYKEESYDANKGPRDIAFFLLKMFIDPDIKLEKVLLLENFSEDKLSYRLPWLLYIILSKVKNFKDFSDINLNSFSQIGDKLTLSYVEELESKGLWEWSIFVALFLSNKLQRSGLISHIIQRNYNKKQDENQDEELQNHRIYQFLKDVLSIPDSLFTKIQIH